MANAPYEAASSVDAGQLTQALEKCLERLLERGRALLRQRYEANENATALATRFAMTAEAIRQALLRLRLQGTGELLTEAWWSRSNKTCATACL